MREVDKRYYKINKNGTERIYTNVYRSGENYSAYEADKNGKAGKFLYLLTQSEIDKAIISENFDFSEKDFNYIYKAYMVNAKEYDNGNKETSGVWITFPADKTEIAEAMESIGLSYTSHSGEYFFDDFVCNIDSIKNLLFADLTVLQLQETAIKLNTLTNFEILKLNAIMETNAKFNSLAEVAEFAGNYDYYDLIPNVRNEMELGLNLIYSSNIFEGIPDRFKDAIEPKSYGKYIAEVEKGIFTSKGYISRSDDEWEPLNLPDFKPKPLKTNGIDDKMIDTTEILAVDLDSFYRDISSEYENLADDPHKAITDIANKLRIGNTQDIRRQLGSFMKEEHLNKSDIQPFLNRLNEFDKRRGIEKNSIKAQLKQSTISQSSKVSKKKTQDLEV